MNSTRNMDVAPETQTRQAHPCWSGKRLVAAAAGALLVIAPSIAALNARSASNDVADDQPASVDSRTLATAASPLLGRPMAYGHRADAVNDVFASADQTVGAPVLSASFDGPTTAPSDMLFAATQPTANSMPGGAMSGGTMATGGAVPNAMDNGTLPPTPATRPSADSVITSGLDPDGRLTLFLNRSRMLTTASRLRSAQNDSAAVTTGSGDVIAATPVGPNSVLISAKKLGATNLIIEDDLGRQQVVEVAVVVDMGALNAQLKTLMQGGDLTASDASGAVVLRGHAPSLEVADQAAQMAAPYGGKVINFIEIAGGQQVMLEVKFAEVSRSVESQLGINFGYTDGRTFGAMQPGNLASFSFGGTNSGIFGTPGANTSVFGSAAIGRSAFEYFVAALRTNNLMRTLAEPNLLALSGEKASFQAGGEIPIPVTQGGAGSGNTAITIQYQDYGIILNFIPVVLGDGRIRLNVDPEVSDLDYSTAVQLSGTTIPGLTKRSVHTVVELGEGQTLAIAGLLNNKVNANASQIPVLGDLPVLGALFRSVQYTRNQTELVVMVTPHLVKAMNPEDVPSAPGEHWRYPTEGDLFLNADLGGEVGDGKDKPATAVNNGPAPQFHGQYGFTPTATTNVLQP